VEEKVGKIGAALTTLPSIVTAVPLPPAALEASPVAEDYNFSYH